MKAKIKKTAGKAKKQNFLLIIEKIYLTGWNSSWYDIRKRKIYYKVISKSIIRVSHMCWEHGGEALQNLMGGKKGVFQMGASFLMGCFKKVCRIHSLPPPLTMRNADNGGSKWKKKNGGYFFFFFFLHFWMSVDLKPTQLTSTYRRLLQSPKPGSSRESFLPENGFKTWYTVYFSKKHLDFWGQEINGKHEIQTWFLLKMSFYIVTQYNMTIVLSI